MKGWVLPTKVVFVTGTENNFFGEKYKFEIVARVIDLIHVRVRDCNFEFSFSFGLVIVVTRGLPGTQ